MIIFTLLFQGAVQVLAMIIFTVVISGSCSGSHYDNFYCCDFRELFRFSL